MNWDGLSDNESLFPHSLYQLHDLEFWPVLLLDNSHNKVQHEDFLRFDFMPWLPRDIQYMGDHIIVQTLYPDDSWLYQALLSFGKNVEVIEPAHIRKKLQNEAQEILCMYS